MHGDCNAESASVSIKYKWRRVYIRPILSHAEYDEKGSKIRGAICV